MKILIISDAWLPQINGVVRTYECIIPELEKMGHTISVIGPRDFRFTMPLPGYSEIKLALFSKLTLQKKITAIDPDIIHIATEGPLGINAQKFCLKNDIPFSTSFHTQFPDYLKKRVEKIVPALANFSYKAAVKKIVRFHNNAESILVTTTSIQKQLDDWGITSRKDIFTRGVDTSIFNCETSPSPYKDAQEPIALFVGRIAIEKNIEAFLDMKWHGTKVIVGQGPDQEKLEEQYPDVVFAGKQTGKELASYYKNADVFVFPSKTDTFGMVLIEALACGLPIAAYPVMGPQDIVTEGFLGVLRHDLSEAARKALDIEDKQSKYDYISQHYTWKKAAEQFIKASPVIKKEKKAA